jgi:hypothetical protein
MATVYADALGKVLTVDAPEVGRVVFSPPAGGLTLDFDGEANGRVVEALVAGPERFTLVAGVLQRDGKPVPIAAESAAGRDRRMLAAIRAKLDSDTAPTAQELRAGAWVRDVVG